MPILKFFLLIDELKELLPSQRKNLIKSAKHKAFEELIRNAKNWWSVRLGLLIGATLTVEDILLRLGVEFPYWDFLELGLA